MSEPIHEPEITQNRNEGSLAVTGELETATPLVFNAKTDSEEAICEDDKSAGKPSGRPLQPNAENLSAIKSKQTKVVKKRRSANEAQGGKKRKASKDTEEGEKGKENAKYVTSIELLSLKETQNEQNLADEGKGPLADKRNDKHQMNTQDASCEKEDGGNNSKLSTTSESRLGVPKEKQQRKKSLKSKNTSQDSPVEEDATVDKTSNVQTMTTCESQPGVSKEKQQRSISQDNPADEDATVDKMSNQATKSRSASSESLPGVSNKKQQRKKSGKSKSISQDNTVDKDAHATVDKISSQTTESKSSQSLIDSEDAGKGRGPARPKNQTSKVDEQSNSKRQSNKSRSASGKGASSSQVLHQNEESGQHPTAQKPGFALKRSAASIDVRVNAASLSEDDSARKKSLPKLVKAAFKPPIANKGEKSGKAPAKMPKLLKPHFVSPALTKPAENNHDARKEEQVPKSVASSEKSIEKNAVPKKDVAGKRRVQDNDQFSTGETSKKAREDEEHNRDNDILSGKG